MVRVRPLNLNCHVKLGELGILLRELEIKTV